MAMLTPGELEIRAARLARSLPPWVAECRAAVDAKVDDAAAHASKALTDTVKVAPDGRATIAKLRQSASYNAAVNRLTELRDKLVAIVGDAREAFYRDSYAEWAGLLPVEVTRPNSDAGPADAGISAARVAVIHGHTLMSEVTFQVHAAKRSLLSTLAMAGMRSTSDRGSADLIGAWARRTKESLMGRMGVVLGDSLADADRRAGRDVCKPELLHDNTGQG